MARSLCRPRALTAFPATLSAPFRVFPRIIYFSLHRAHVRPVPEHRIFSFVSRISWFFYSPTREPFLHRLCRFQLANALIINDLRQTCTAVGTRPIRVIRVIRG